MAGIYVHIPFCRTKCPYCDFYSITRLTLRDRFLEALRTEIRLRAYELHGMEMETIYLGGGTPSMLRGEAISEILDSLRMHFTISESPEITMECNPGDLTTIDLDRILGAGVNRFSIGAQTFDPKLLRLLRRRHTAKETMELVAMLHDSGIHNISLDLMYGLPGSTMGTLERDLDALIELEPTHVSAYHLIYEEGTPLYYRMTTGRVTPIDEELSLRQSHRVAERLRAAGYEHYEISAFALPGYRSRHNSSYWHGIPYIGLGPGAHSYIHPWRSHDPSDLATYVRELSRPTPFLNRSYERITPEMALEEYLLTRLRTAEGIDLEEIKRNFSATDRKRIEESARPYIDTEKLIADGSHLRLSLEGIDLSDAIILDLI